MLQKPAILYVEKIECEHTTGEAGEDEIWFRYRVDGVTHYYPGSSKEDRFIFKKGGGTQYVDLAINVTYANEVVFELIEGDDPDPDHSSNEFVGSHTLNRGSVDDPTESRRVDMDWNGETSGEYWLTYRIISDPIPTVRVLGIRCEQQSAGMNTDLVGDIADVASTVTEEAGKIIGKSPRPRAKLIGDAFKAASKVLQGVATFVEWIGQAIEGDYDEVYMDHVESTKGYGGAFFPPEGYGDYEKMKNEDDIYFEEKYGEYFRFPLDRGPVTLQFREHDDGKADVNIGTLTIAPDSLAPGSSAGVSGTTVNGGVATMDGPAVVELANSYGGREGEGALYHMCYSVGFEDWCKPATTEAQGGGESLKSGEVYNIVARHSGKALTISGDDNAAMEDGANIVQSELTESAKQQFRLWDLGNGYYYFTSWYSGKSIMVPGDETTSMQDGANVAQWEYVNSYKQMFKLQYVSDGYYSIIARHSEKAVMVPGDETTSMQDGANVAQWEYVNSYKQMFRFDPK